MPTPIIYCILHKIKCFFRKFKIILTNFRKILSFCSKSCSIHLFSDHQSAKQQCYFPHDLGIDIHFTQDSDAEHQGSQNNSFNPVQSLTMPLTFYSHLIMTTFFVTRPVLAEYDQKEDGVKNPLRQNHGK